MAEITQVITPFTGDDPTKEMDADDFDVAAEIQVAYINDMAAELNTFATQANALGVSANDLVAALAAANFSGEWSGLSGALATPACVLHDGQYWMLLNNLADVTASEPADTNTDWVLYQTAEKTIAKTADYSITAADCRGYITFTNKDATGAVNFPLPAVSADYRLRFYVAANQYLKVTANGTETIRRGGEQTVAGGYIRSNAIGTYFELSGAPGTEWVLPHLDGELSVDE